MLAEKITIIRLSSYHFQLLTFNLKQSLATFIARKSSNYFCRKMSVKLQEKSPIILLKLALIKLLKSFVKKCLTIKK